MTRLSLRARLLIGLVALTVIGLAVAAVVTYIRTAWGNHGSAISAQQANELRAVPLD